LKQEKKDEALQQSMSAHNNKSFSIFSLSRSAHERSNHGAKTTASAPSSPAPPVNSSPSLSAPLNEPPRLSSLGTMSVSSRDEVGIGKFNLFVF
jgi:hypothetical protein